MKRVAAKLTLLLISLPALATPALAAGVFPMPQSPVLYYYLFWVVMLP
jgi:hypothetical protein